MKEKTTHIPFNNKAKRIKTSVHAGNPSDGTKVKKSVLLKLLVSMLWYVFFVDK